MQSFLEIIPRENYVVLKRLMKMLHVIACKQEINMMNSQNLGIVFGVNLARSTEDQTATNITVGETLPLFEIMIENYPKIFSGFKRASCIIKTQSYGSVNSSEKRASTSILGLSRFAVRERTFSDTSLDSSNSEENNLPVIKKTGSAIEFRKRKQRKKISMKQISKTKQRDTMASIQNETKKVVMHTTRARPRRSFLVTENSMKCYACNEIIDNSCQTIFIDAERRCHESCFVCNICGIPLTFGSFSMKKNALHCSSCLLQDL